MVLSNNLTGSLSPNRGKKTFIKTIMFGCDKRFYLQKRHGKTPKLFEIQPLVMENEALKVPP